MAGRKKKKKVVDEVVYDVEAYREQYLKFYDDYLKAGGDQLVFFKPSPEFFEVHVERTTPVPRGGVVRYSISKQDPTYFSVNSLGFKPYVWQSLFWDLLSERRSVIVCTPRQVGKTAAIAVFSLHACLFNTLPLESTKKTRIIIVSKTEEQSKKIVSDIKEFIRLGDEYVYNHTGELVKDKKTGELVRVGGEKDFFTNQIDRSQAATNTKGAITFKNGCQIISLPPTDRARGYTGSILFVDEAAFIEDEDLFEQTLKPIVSRSGGLIAVTSTPNGQQGFFFKNFDPFNQAKTHYFNRLWLHYKSFELDDPELVRRRDLEKQVALATGNERQFEQEHEASFNASATSFFDVEDVDAGVKKELMLVDSYDAPCDLGVDFGNVVSRTVISISALETDDEGRDVVRLLYHYEYEPEKDTNLIEDIKALMKRFNIQRVIFEECPAATHYINVAEKEGLPVVLFSPARDKVKTYFQFRAWLRQRRVWYPEVPELVKQMKGLIREDTPRTTKIYHGNGLRDDNIDSFVISTFFLTKEESGLRVWDLDDY